VQIAFDGADGDAPNRLVAARDQERPDELEGALHGTRGDEQLGHEILIRLETASHLVHGGHHVFVDQLQRVNPGGQGFFGD